MAFLKAQEIRSMAHQDRQLRLRELRQDLVHERGVAAMGGSPPSPGKIRQIRRQIARILTIENEERQGIRGQASKRPAAKKPEAAKAAAKKSAAAKAPVPKSKASKAKAAKPAKAVTKAKPKEV